MTVLNTDEMLMEYGELVCSLESILNDVEEGTYQYFFRDLHYCMFFSPV